MRCAEAKGLKQKLQAERERKLSGPKRLLSREDVRPDHPACALRSCDSQSCSCKNGLRHAVL